MSDATSYPVPTDWSRNARVDAERYEQMYARSMSDPGAFWLEQAARLDWVTAPTIAGDWSFAEKDFHISWFSDGVLNVAANCLDRQLAERGEAVALIGGR